jgi:hypothetical protein
MNEKVTLAQDLTLAMSSIHTTFSTYASKRFETIAKENSIVNSGDCVPDGRVSSETIKNGVVSFAE